MPHPSPPGGEGNAGSPDLSRIKARIDRTLNELGKIIEAVEIRSKNP